MSHWWLAVWIVSCWAVPAYAWCRDEWVADERGRTVLVQVCDNAFDPAGPRIPSARPVVPPTYRPPRIPIALPPGARHCNQIRRQVAGRWVWDTVCY